MSYLVAMIVLAGLLAGCSTAAPPSGTIQTRVESFTEIGGWQFFDAKSNPKHYMDVWVDARQQGRTVARAHLGAKGSATLVVPAGTYGVVVVSRIPSTITPGTGPKYVPCQVSQAAHVRARHVTRLTLGCPYYNDGYRLYPTRPAVPYPGVPDSNGIAHP